MSVEPSDIQPDWTEAVVASAAPSAAKGGVGRVVVVGGVKNG